MSMIGRFRRVKPERLSELITNPEQVPDFIRFEEESDDESLEIDKTWHGLQFLLNNCSWEADGPLSMAIAGGTELEGTDFGFGPMRYLTAEQVQAVAEALTEISEDELRSRYDPELMQSEAIYPDDWTQDDDALDYLMCYYPQLVDFFAMAAARQDAVLLWIS